jgi:recombination protein RecA
VRVDVRRIATLKEGDAVIGSRTRAKVVKNKVAAPFREAEFDILYGQGISREGDLIDLGAARGLIDKSGSWFSYRGERIGQGREHARQFLLEHPEVRERLEAELRQALGLPSETLSGASPLPKPALAGVVSPEPKRALAAVR